MRFLLEGERGWIGASKFFDALKRMGISPTLYSIPYSVKSPYIFEPDELQYYLDALEHELRGKEQDEYYDYVKQICLSLGKWAKDRLIVHVVS